MLPFAVVGLFWAITVGIHIEETPNLGDADTLSPAGTGGDGSSRLAAALRAQGVPIHVVTTSADAVASAESAGRATIFVPAPDYLSPEFGRSLEQLAGDYRVVLVEPGLATAARQPFPFVPIDNRWATAIRGPGCSASYAVTAGRAAVAKALYAVPGAAAAMQCYGGGLIEVQLGAVDLVVVGSTDPFRNARFGEVGNSTLAVGVLSDYGPIVWLDLHRREPLPLAAPNLSLPQYRRGSQDRNGTGNPIIDAFPPLLWAVLVGLFAAAVLLAFARGRRLGPPVFEPLPVLVPAAEAVTGRGRLYHRIGARDATLAALRQRAIRRINTAVNPFGGAAGARDVLPGPGGHLPPGAAQLVRTVAARTEQPEEYIGSLLYGPVVDDDDVLVAEVSALDWLVDAVLTGTPSPTDSSAPADRSAPTGTRVGPADPPSDDHPPHPRRGDSP